MELNGCPVACLKYMRKQMYLRSLGCCFYMNFKYIWLILVLNQHIWYCPTEKRCQPVPNMSVLNVLKETTHCQIKPPLFYRLYIYQANRQINNVCSSCFLRYNLHIYAHSGTSANATHQFEMNQSQCVANEILFNSICACKTVERLESLRFRFEHDTLTLQRVFK